MRVRFKDTNEVPMTFNFLKTGMVALSKQMLDTLPHVTAYLISETGTNAHAASQYH